MVIPLSGNNYGCVTVQSKRYPTGVQYKKLVIHKKVGCSHILNLSPLRGIANSDFSSSSFFGQLIKLLTDLKSS